MPSVEEDAVREERIAMEIVVDAYNEDEARSGWYYYLEDRLNCPFKARWLSGSDSDTGEEVDVMGLAEEAECTREMRVEIRYREGEVEDIFPVPITAIDPLNADEETQEAIADWQYWVNRGYAF